MSKPIVSIDARVSLDLEGLTAKLRTKNHKASRKANKLVKMDTSMQSIGKYYLVKTNVGLAPHNTRRGTEYMLPANSECIAVQMKGWLALYLTKGMTYDSIQDVMDKCKHIRAKDNYDPSRGKWPEFRIIGLPVFRDSAKVAFKQLLPKDWVNDADAYVPRIKEVYGM